MKATINQSSPEQALSYTHSHPQATLYVGVLAANCLLFCVYQTRLLTVIDLFFFPLLVLLHTHTKLHIPNNNHILCVCVCVLQVEQTSRPDLALFLIKYLMMLIVGIPSVFWVGSKKTCFEWASFFHGKRRKEYVLYRNWF